MAMPSNPSLPEVLNTPAALAEQLAPLVSRLWMLSAGPAVPDYRVGIVRQDRPWQAGNRQAIVVPAENISNAAVLLH